MNCGYSPQLFLSPSFISCQTAGFSVSVICSSLSCQKSNVRLQKTPTAFAHLVDLHSSLVLPALMAPYGLLELNILQSLVVCMPTCQQVTGACFAYWCLTPIFTHFLGNSWKYFFFQLIILLKQTHSFTSRLCSHWLSCPVGWVIKSPNS